MESQQTRLIEALRKLHRHVKQPIGEEDMQEILQTVRACGFDVEGVNDIQQNALESKPSRAPYNSIDPVGNGATNGSDDKEDTNGENRNGVMGRVTGSDCLGKRKRAECGQLLKRSITPGRDMDIPGNAKNISPDVNGGSDLAHESATSPLKRQKPAAPTEMVDDYWSLDDYLDQVTTPHNPSNPPTIPDTAVSNPVFDVNLPNMSNSMQQPPETSSWSWNDLSQSLTMTDNAPTFETNQVTSINPIGEASDALPPFEALHDLGSTIWWDPSSLFGTRNGNSDLDDGDLPIQPFDLSYGVNGGSF